MIKLSLILPIYNSDKTLSKCLDSLALSFNKNFEVILKKKKFINEFYRQELKNTKKISILDTPQYSNNNYWQSNLLIKSKKNCSKC